MPHEARPVSDGAAAMSMHIKQLQYLTALARHMHFGRAAEECRISQPALSQAIQQLERTFGVPIVERRSYGFQGFTPHGTRILEWGRTVLSGYEHLNQELGFISNEGLRGHLRVGVIPVAVPGISIITTAFNRLYPNVSMSVRSLNFTDLKKGLENFEIDIAITYLDLGDSTGLRPYFLYDEFYYLVAPVEHGISNLEAISWNRAGQLPLCMLTPDMQNRRILDRVFASVGATPRTVIETDCALALCSHVRPGHWFTVVPHTFFLIVGDWAQTRALPLIDPVVTNAVGMLIVERDPQPPVTHAFIEVAQNVGLADALKRHVPMNSTAAIEAPSLQQGAK
jgi:DNA-binding transcriptional LysR family regulator